MQAVALIASDGDEKIYKPIDSAIKTRVLGGRRARCIHVCLYVCCMYDYTHVCMYLRMYACMYDCMYVCMYVMYVVCM